MSSKQSSKSKSTEKKSNVKNTAVIPTVLLTSIPTVSSTSQPINIGVKQPDLQAELKKYIDDNNKQFQLNILRYIDEQDKLLEHKLKNIDNKLDEVMAKLKHMEVKDKELVLSDQNLKNIRGEINSILKKDIVPQFNKAMNQTMSYVKYTGEDCSEQLQRFREETAGVTKFNTRDPNLKMIAQGHSKATPVQSSLFVFDGDQ